jgi:mannose-6-phosphate isomerase
MSKLESPLRFETFLRPMVWGGQSLARRLHKRLPTSEPIGESWEVSDHRLHHSVVAEGPWRGTSMRALMTERRAELLGAAAEHFDVFPWLIKFLDCRDWLSVQVHPDAKKVETLCPGERSKTEAWYILDAEPGSKIWAGLKPGVGPRELRAGLERGEVVDLLHSFTPRAGQCVFLPAGTVHAVGGGILMAEIQETSDATFRLFDWNRLDAQGKSRQLHIEESLASIHWDKGPVQPIETKSGPATQRLVRCPYFELDYVASSGTLTLGGAGKLQTAMIVGGEGAWSDGTRVETGQVWVLPAAMPAREATGELVCVVGTLP